MKNFRCYVVMLVLLGMISGWVHHVSAVRAPLKRTRERTFGQQMTDESIETKAKVNINAADEVTTRPT